MNKEMLSIVGALKSGANAPTDFQKQQHIEAFQQPYPGFENALVHLCLGLAAYADAHAQRYKDGDEINYIGDDVLGDEWTAIARGIQGLLNGERGRLDGGTINSFLITLSRAHRVDLIAAGLT